MDPAELRTDVWPCERTEVCDLREACGERTSAAWAEATDPVRDPSREPPRDPGADPCCDPDLSCERWLPLRLGPRLSSFGEPAAPPPTDVEMDPVKMLAGRGELILSPP